METDVKSMAADLKNKAANFNPQKKESKVAKAIEAQTARLPSDTFLWASITAMATSLTLKLFKHPYTFPEVIIS